MYSKIYGSVVLFIVYVISFAEIIPELISIKSDITLVFGVVLGLILLLSLPKYFKYVSSIKQNGK